MTSPLRLAFVGAFLAGVGGCRSSLPASADASTTDAASFDGPVCPDAPVGPLSFWDGKEQRLGWRLLPPADGSVAAAADADAPDGAAPSPCQTLGSGGIQCHGAARLESLAGSDVLTFSDGTKLVWDGSVDTSPPVISNPTGDSVWVDYQDRLFVCPEGFCGSDQSTLEVRDAPGGRLRYFGQAGFDLAPLTDAKVLDVFGAAAIPVPQCSFHVQLSCVSYDRTEYQHQLQTTPPQTVGRAWSDVQTPNGKYRVFWASSVEFNVKRAATTPSCTDDPGAVTDNGFVAILLPP